MHVSSVTAKRSKQKRDSEIGEIVCFVPLLYIPGKGHLYMPPAPRDRIISFLSHRDQCAFACLNREGERVIDSYRAYVLADGRFFHSLSF